MTDSSSAFCPDCGRPIPEDAPMGLCPRCLLSEAATEAGSSLERATQPSGPTEPSLEQVVAAFPWLDILERLGQGGMGVVYKARQRKLDRLVALKLLRCPKEQEHHFAERFLREARALAKLNHANIVTVYDFGESQGLYYLMMEYVDGVSLREAMGGGRLTPEEALRIVPVVCQALQIAHDHGILHRDIKPANILLSRTGVVKMADFGLAKFVDEPQDPADGPGLLTRTESSLGTPAYMAPEQTTDPSRVDHRADIYSLGVVFYEMLTGELPLGRFPAPSSRSTVDQRVDEVVLRTLEREPQERYQTAKEMQTDVEDLSQSDVGPDPSTRQSTAPPQPKSPREAPSPLTTEAPVLAPQSPSSAGFSWIGLLAGLFVFLSLPAALTLVDLLTEVRARRATELPTVYAMGYSLAAILGQNVSIFLGIIGTLLGWIEAIRLRHQPFTKTGTLLIAVAALAWPLIFTITWTFLLANSWSHYSTHFPALALFLALPTVVYVLTRYRRWILNTPHAKTKNWYWAYAFIIFYTPFYPMFHKSVARHHEQAFAHQVVEMDVATLERKLDEGVDVDQRTPQGETALMLTTDVAKARVLIAHGADVNAALPDGITPLLLAAQSGHQRMLKLLFENGADIQATLDEDQHRFNALHLAARNGHEHVVDYLIDFGLKVDSRDNDGRTALMMAAENGQSAVIETLLSVGTEDTINLTDVQGNTALDHAIANGQPTEERILLRRGARETASYWLRQAYSMRLHGWGQVIDHLQKSQTALVPNHPKLLSFGFDGWWYRFENPELTLNALLVEAASRGKRPDIAEAAFAQGKQCWPSNQQKIPIFQRQDAPSLPTTVQVLHLDRSDLDNPIRSGQHRAVLSGWTRTQGMHRVGSGGLNSSTFFR